MNFHTFCNIKIVRRIFIKQNNMNNPFPYPLNRIKAYRSVSCMVVNTTLYNRIGILTVSLKVTLYDH